MQFKNSQREQIPILRTMSVMNDYIDNYKRTKQSCGGVNAISPLLNLKKCDMFLQGPVDPMHCLSGIVRNRLGILSGINDKNEKIRLEEKMNRRFEHFWDNVFFKINFDWKNRQQAEDG